MPKRSRHRARMRVGRPQALRAPDVVALSRRKDGCDDTFCRPTVVEWAVAAVEVF